MKHTIHLHAHFNGQGKFTSWFPYDTKLSCTPGDTGFFVWVSEHEVEIPTPDSWEVAREEALRAIANAEKEIRARMQDSLTQFTFMKNNLLGLAAPEILDPLNRHYF